MRKKFKILYPKDHIDQDKAGKQYKPKGKDMLVVNHHRLKTVASTLIETVQ